MDVSGGHPRISVATVNSRENVLIKRASSTSSPPPSPSSIPSHFTILQYEVDCLHGLWMPDIRLFVIRRVFFFLKEHN